MAHRIVGAAPLVEALIFRLKWTPLPPFLSASIVPVTHFFAIAKTAGMLQVLLRWDSVNVSFKTQMDIW